MQRLLSTMFLLVLLALTACGGQPTPTAATSSEIDLATLPALVDPQTANLVRERDDVLLIDVREPSEYDAGHIPGITLIPMGEIPNRLADIPKDKTVIVSCQSGRRSSQIASTRRPK